MPDNLEVVPEDDEEELYIDKAREEGYCEETIELGVIIPSRNKDYKKRFGLKGKPFTKEFEITQTISVLHASKLCAFKFVENLVCRVSAGCLKWSAGVIGKETITRLRKHETQFRFKLKDLLGYQDHNFGNQVTGNMVTLFFSESVRSRTLAMIKDMQVFISFIQVLKDMENSLNSRC